MISWLQSFFDNFSDVTCLTISITIIFFVGLMGGWAFLDLDKRDRRKKINIAELLRNCPNGYKWDNETKTLVKLVEPQFKDGDRIKPKGLDRHYIIKNIKNDRYILNNNNFLRFNDEHNFELVPNKFDITTLVPFESRVLVRNDINQLWIPAFWGYKRDNGYATTFGWSQYCIPFEGNEHLLNTANDCDNFFKVWEES